MVSNEGKITTFGTTGTLGGLVDATDKLHSGILKTLWNVSNGSRVVSSGTFTQSSNRFTLAGTVVYRSLGTKYTLAGNNYADVTAGDATYDRYDLIYIDRSADALAIAAGTAAASSRVADIAPEDVPVAIVKVVAGAAATATHSFQMLLSTFDKDVLSDDEVTYAKIQNVVNDERVLGRVSGADGVIEELTQAQVLTFLGGVEAGADVTDAANVNAAGAVMHTDIPDSDTGFVKRTGSEIYDIDTNTYLTASDPTLHSVTTNGSSTTNDVTVGSLSSSAYILGDASIEAGPTMGVNDLYYFINAGSIILPTAASCAQRLLFLKNIHSSTCTITLSGGDVFDGIPSAATGINPNPDQRVVAASPAQALTLEVGESVILVAMTDSVSPLVTGYYVLSLDTQTGIANVVEDTTPQLGGNLDVNGNSIVSTSGADINITPNGTGQVNLGNFQFDVDQSVGSGQDNYVLTYDHANTQISLEPASGGMSDVVDDTTPQLGGDLDTNSKDITGDFALTGAVQMKKSVVATGNVSPLASAADSGKYFYRANAETANFTLPADTYVGEQYVLMNNSGSSITIASTGGDTIVGSTSVPHESAVTIIAVAANTWFVVG